MNDSLFIAGALAIGRTLNENAVALAGQQQRQFEWMRCYEACLARGATVPQAQVWTNAYFEQIDARAYRLGRVYKGIRYSGWWFLGLLLFGAMWVLGSSGAQTSPGFGIFSLVVAALLLANIVRLKVKEHRIQRETAVDITVEGDGVTQPMRVRLSA